jgi:putative PIN family toxin of toxin-antitoxin system
LRVVVDANIFISALLNPLGAPAQLVAAVRAAQYTLVTSAPLLQEVERVLQREKFARRGVTPEMIADLLALLNHSAEVVQIEGTLRLCRDPKADQVIETAVSGRADAVVTGDKDLTDAVEVTDYLAEREIQVLSVRVFLGVLQLLRPDQPGPPPPGRAE